MIDIVGILFNNLKRRLINQHIKFDITDEVKEFIADKGFDPEYGARPLLRTIRKFIEDPLSEEMLKNEINPPVKILTYIEKGKITFKENK